MKNLTYKHKMVMVFDYENLLVIEVLFDLNLNKLKIWRKFFGDFGCKMRK